MPSPLPGLLLGALLCAAPLTGHAEMSPPERETFRAEVRAYLLENPQILSEMILLLEERQKAATVAADAELISRNADRIFDDGYSFVGGNPAGGLTIVEFLDYQCGYCRQAHPEIVDLVSSDGDIRWIVKELPILGPASEIAARAAIATLIVDGPETYAALSAALMRLDGPVTDASLDATLTDVGADPAAIRAAMTGPEVTRRIDATRTLARDLGIQGTPSFVMGDRMLRGYLPLAAMRDFAATVRAGN